MRTLNALICALLLLAPTTGRAAGDTFEGSCGAAVETIADRPFPLLVPGPVNIVVHGSGFCSGTLNGTHYESAPVEVDGAAELVTNCPTLDIRVPQVMRFTFGTSERTDDVLLDIVYQARVSLMLVTWEGTDGGLAVGNTIPTQDGLPPEACERDRYTHIAYLRTLTPLAG